MKKLTKPKSIAAVRNTIRGRITAECNSKRYLRARFKEISDHGKELPDGRP